MKRLFYLMILLGAFTVTQPGCGLLFFPVPDMDVEEEMEEEEDMGGVLFPVDDEEEAPVEEAPAEEAPVEEAPVDPELEEEQELFDEGGFDGPDLDPDGFPIPEVDEDLLAT